MIQSHAQGACLDAMVGLTSAPQTSALIVTKRTYLREISQSDVAALAVILGDSRGLQMQNVIMRPSRVFQHLMYRVRATEQGVGTTLTIFDKESAQPIGAVTFRDIERASATVGYFLSPKYWGKGILTEVLPAATDYAMKIFKLEAIDAVVTVSNLASRRVLEKSGFTTTGRPIANEYPLQSARPDEMHLMYVKKKN